MEKVGFEETGGALPPPPPLLPPHGRPERLTEPPKRVAISRTGVGRSGRRINLVANHFKVSVNVPDSVFFQYSVLIKSEDNQEVEGKGIGRKVMDKLYQTYSSELAGKNFAYDGEKALYTVGSLPQKKFEFTVVLEEAAVKRSGSPDLTGMETDRKRTKGSFRSKTFSVEISFAARIPMKPIARALKGFEAKNTGDVLRVIDIILRQQAAKRGCLLVRQSFFHDDVRNFVSVGGGVTACRGFHSSFRTTQGGLSLNMDVSSTMILTPGPVLDFLLTNQNLRDPQQIDWGRAKKLLKNLRVKAIHNNMEFKIIGISEKACNQQYFPLKMRGGDGSIKETMEVTVYDYFKNRNIELANSAYMPCLDVGKLKRPNYLPLELCSLISLQRYTKALSSMLRASLVEKSRQKPQERIQTVTDAVKNYRYDDDPMLKACGISIEKQLTAFEGRVLNAPTLKIGNNEGCVPRNGRCNFNHKRLISPIQIKCWAIVNFSARCDMSFLSQELIKCGRSKGIHIDNPHSLIEEDSQWRRAGPVVRVEKLFEQVKAKLPGPPEFLLCVLPERKNCDIYGPWKKKNLHEMGIFTQCLSPMKINDQYLTNVLLKLNSKLGGMNSLFEVERIPTLPLLKETPTMILGMDVSHGSPGQSDVPSIAAVVGSRSWPLISKYRGSVRTQSPKVEMIDSLFKLLPNGEYDGIIRELLVEFYNSDQGHKPEQIITSRIVVNPTVKLPVMLHGVDYFRMTLLVSKMDRESTIANCVLLQHNPLEISYFNIDELGDKSILSSNPGGLILLMGQDNRSPSYIHISRRNVVVPLPLLPEDVAPLTRWVGTFTISITSPIQPMDTYILGDARNYKEGIVAFYVFRRTVGSQNWVFCQSRYTENRLSFSLTGLVVFHNKLLWLNRIGDLEIFVPDLEEFHKFPILSIPFLEWAHYPTGILTYSDHVFVFIGLETDMILDIQLVGSPGDYNVIHRVLHQWPVDLDLFFINKGQGAGRGTLPGREHGDIIFVSRGGTHIRNYTYVDRRLELISSSLDCDNCRECMFCLFFI